MEKPFKFIFLSLLTAVLSLGCAQEITATPALESFLANSTKPAAIKFYAEWCSSCEEYAPTYNKAKEEHLDDMDFFSVDIDDKTYKKLVKEMKVSMIPVTVITDASRNRVKKFMGPLSYKRLEKEIKKVLEDI